MKKLLGLSALVLVVFPAAAMAQANPSNTGNVAVNGRVAPVCILGGPNPALVDLGVMIAITGTRAGRIAVLPAQSVSLPASFCNFAGSQVTVTANALLAANAGAPPAGFARAVNYTATAAGWAAGNAATTTAATANGSSASSTGSGPSHPLPKLADIGVTLSSFSVPGDNLLVTGNYSGTVTVTLGPAAVAN
ncbi:MAG TPA: hypothetical protein VHG29_01765 [Novosphingobium sp.]|nr:hypothetical protein [Novosphingobium sp.]